MKNVLSHTIENVDLWTHCCKNYGGSLNITEVLPRVGEFIAGTMCVRRVAIWLRANRSDTAYTLEYYHAPTTVERGDRKTIHRVRNLAPAELNKTFKIADPTNSENTAPIDNEASLSDLGITRYAFAGNNNQILAVLGVDDNPRRKALSAQDDRFLLRVSDQFASLIVRRKFSEERSLAHEWESLNRFTAFIIHDLKNLATVQSMTLENAKQLSHNTQFVADALATFRRTTDKMIGLIASFSIQRGQFSLKQQPVNVLDVIHETFEDLRLQQRNGVLISTKFPPQETPPIISGDPELLQKVFTNVLLNAIQSLPHGMGSIDISVVHDNAGKIIATVRDTGCGIPPPSSCKTSFGHSKPPGRAEWVLGYATAFPSLRSMAVKSGSTVNSTAEQRWSWSFHESRRVHHGSSSVKPKLLLVDDEECILTQMRWSMEADYEIFTASNEEGATQLFEREHPPVITLDLSLNRLKADDLGGLRLLEQFLSADPAARIIVMTGNIEDISAIRAVRLGACDFYAKPLRLDEIKVIVQRAFHLYPLQQKIQARHLGAADGFDGIIGRSKPMKEIFRFIERVAGSDMSVLISDESGTGKEVVANAIHRHSPRKNNPFVGVNCGAIPENLLESELFGHEKGAFTGAHAQKKGKFELAHTGTLFLDEIGELAQTLQVKLLRFLQDRRIERVGGTQLVELDLRIIAATNRDLQNDMENHVFREDLYYRLKVVPLDMPPLRARKDDIVPLPQHFLRTFCQDHGKSPMSLSAQAEGAMLMHPWPGNVRELENLISRAVVLSPGNLLQPGDLGFAPDTMPTEVNLKFAKQAIEIDFVNKALARNRGIVSRAARELGISRVNRYELIDKYAIQVKQFKKLKKGENSELNHGR